MDSDSTLQWLNDQNWPACKECGQPVDLECVCSVPPVEVVEREIDALVMAGEWADEENEENQVEVSDWDDYSP